MKSYLYIICLLGLAQVVGAEVQTLRFSNGDQLSGEVLGTSATHVTLVTSFGQELQIPLDVLEPRMP